VVVVVEGKGGGAKPSAYIGATVAVLASSPERQQKKFKDKLLLDIRCTYENNNA